MAKLPNTIFCIHGNHEMRPHTIDSYREKVWNGGTVYAEDEYPNILFAKDGEVFDFDGTSTIAIGGAYSVDKWYRLQRGWSWFADEQPDKATKSRVEQALGARHWKTDVVLSHTCPVAYEPVEVFIGGIDQSTVDKSTEEWLGELENKLNYQKWYCGHYHTAKRVDHIQFMFDDFDALWSKDDATECFLDD